MHRSSRWRRRRRSGSMSSAHARRRTLGASPTAAVTAIPDGTRQLSDALVIDASVVARLLRIRLLTLDASVIVSPAEMKVPHAGDVPGRGISIQPAGSRGRPGRIGAGLAGAEQAIEEGAATLAASLRARSTG